MPKPALGVQLSLQPACGSSRVQHRPPPSPAGLRPVAAFRRNVPGKVSRRGQQGASRRSLSVRALQTPAEVLDQIASAAIVFPHQHPTVFKSLVSGATYGFGDFLCQLKNSRGWSSIDKRRLCNFALSGFGGGFMWAWWYEALDHALAKHGIPPGAVATTLSILLEQFLFAPFFFGVYVLPFNSLLKWRSTENIIRDVKVELLPTLWGNAQVWTFLNIIIYNAPLDIRTYVSNLGDLIWSSYLSFLIQDECDTTDEICNLEKEEVTVFLRDAAMELPALTRDEASQTPIEVPVKD